MTQTQIIPEGWKEINIVDNLESLIDYRGKTPKKSDSGILTLSAKSVKMGIIDYSQAYYISKETYDKFMTRGFPKKGDILMTTEAPLGCLAKLDRDDVGIAQRLLTLRGKQGVLDNDYLMYYLMSPWGQHRLLSRASGSTVQGIKRSEFDFVKILVPTNFKEQKAIASILSSLDDKIELLREQNQTLENIAQAIFHEWFVNFNYPGATGEMIESELGEIPKGWRVTGISEFVDHVKDSTSPAEYPKKLFSHYSIPSFDNGKVPQEDLGESIKSNKYVIPENSFLVSKLNPGTPRVWTIFQSNENGVCSSEFQVIQPKQDIFFGFIYGVLNSGLYTRKLAGRAHGTSSSHQRVRPSDILDVPVFIPTQDLIKQYGKVVKPMLLKVNKNYENIQSSSKTRDTLLPKLMSGKVRVKF